MFKNAFANLQKVGKSLMLPVSVLPIAGILLGVGSANFSWLPAVVSHVMAEAGGSVFANMPLIFAIGVALGFTNNDGVSALAAVVAYGIMVKTMAVVAPLVLHLPADEIAAKHLADTGVLGGIISGAIAAYMFNRFYRIKLPEYLGFFCGQAFCADYLWSGRYLHRRDPLLHLAADRLRDPNLLPVGCLSEPSGGVWYLRFHRTLPGAVWSASHLERSFPDADRRIHQRGWSGVPRRYPALHGRRPDGGQTVWRLPVQNVWSAGSGYRDLALC